MKITPSPTAPTFKDATKDETPKKKILKDGFTTGTASAAAVAAATWVLFYDKTLTQYQTLLPPFTLSEQTDHINQQNKTIYTAQSTKRLTIPINNCQRKTMHNGNMLGIADVIKDAGDDPDVTHNAKIEAKVFWFTPDLNSSAELNLIALQKIAQEHGAKSSVISLENNIFLFAGAGIGIATLPGLPINIGEAAINPDPRLQIAATLDEIRTNFLSECKAQALQNEILTSKTFNETSSIVAIISVENGEQIAKKTLNPKLGIIGGISILGTRGIVKPFSHEAWEHSIIQALSVNKALGSETVVLCTGRRSEELIQGVYPDLSPQAFIQAADYVGSALKEATKKGFKKIVWACFWGKLVKLAQGMENTHAHRHELNLNFLADKVVNILKEKEHNQQQNRTQICLELNTLEQKIRTANTAREALVYIKETEQNIANELINFVGESALKNAIKLMRSEAKNNKHNLTLELICFDFNGEYLFKQQENIN